LGIGNTLLGDDGVGIYLARQIKKEFGANDAIDVKEANNVGGIALLDLITGYTTVIILDAIITRQGRPGTLYKLAVEDLGTVIEPYMLHAIDLRTAIELGKMLGYHIPDAITLYAIEIRDNTIFREGLSPEIEEVIPVVMQQIMSALN
jgi:hydrogenase maturation protease